MRVEQSKAKKRSVEPIVAESFKVGSCGGFTEPVDSAAIMRCSVDISDFVLKPRQRSPYYLKHDFYSRVFSYNLIGPVQFCRTLKQRFNCYRHVLAVCSFF